MYYLSKKDFRKETKLIYEKLFSGFSFVKCNFKNRENKYKEHFAKVLTLEDMPTMKDGVLELPKKEKIERKNKSCSYLMTKEERLNKIKNNIAIQLGFKNFFDYSSKMKFKKDREEMKPLNTMSFNEYINTLDNFKEQLKIDFNFTTKINLKLSFLNTVFNENKNSLLNNSPNFFNALSYFYNHKNLTTEKLEDFKELSLEDIKILKNLNKLNKLSDLYVAGNDKEEFSIRVKKYNQLKFIKKINYMHEVKDIKSELIALSDHDFSIFLDIASVCFYKEFVEVFKSIRENKDNKYFNFLNSFNSHIKDCNIDY